MPYSICSKCFSCFNLSKCEETDSFLYCVYSDVFSCSNEDPNECGLDCNSYVSIGSVPFNDSYSELSF